LEITGTGILQLAAKDINFTGIVLNYRYLFKQIRPGSGTGFVQNICGSGWAKTLRIRNSAGNTGTVGLSLVPVTKFAGTRTVIFILNKIHFVVSIGACRSLK
jgi:hypothetical protein